MNVFTGPNNSGKSTVLWVLGELLVYPFGMPEKLLRSDQCTWKLSYSSSGEDHTADGPLPTRPKHTRNIFDVIGYSSFLPAQRLGTNFRSSGPTVGQDFESWIDSRVTQIVKERPNLLQRVGREELRQLIRQSNERLGPEFSRRENTMPSGSESVSNETMIQKIIDLDYAGYRRRKPGMRAIVENIGSLASEITEGYPLTFLGVEEDENGLFPKFATPNGDLPLNVLSQGTQSLIHCLAHLLLGYGEYYNFPADLKEKPGILIIDEVDAHLHPSWQRRIIPTLTTYFPKLQIFCSTHSPLMLAGLRAGQVQLLRREDGASKVTVSRNESDVAGWTADEILRNFLEVPSPTDLATETSVSRLQELRRKEKLSAAESEELEQLRHTVHHGLLNSQVTAEIEKFAEILSRSGNEAATKSDSPPTAR